MSFRILPRGHVLPPLPTLLITAELIDRCGNKTELFATTQVLGRDRVLGGECSRPLTAREQAGRCRLVDLGDWPATIEGIRAASFAVVAARFSDYYDALLHDRQPRM